jgi:hypothetical protein
MYTYPKDHKTKDGEPFWKLPKRPPVDVKIFDPQDKLQVAFVTAFAVLRAKLFEITYPKEFRTDQAKA